VVCVLGCVGVLGFPLVAGYFVSLASWPSLVGGCMFWSLPGMKCSFICFKIKIKINPTGAIRWPVSSHLTQRDGFKRHPQHNSVIVATLLLFHFSRHFSYAVQRFRGTCRLTDSELDAFLNKSLTPSYVRFGWNYMSSKLGANWRVAKSSSEISVNNTFQLRDLWKLCTWQYSRI
jgi:hypothetical protein